MGRFAGALCRARGGHRWTTTSDVAGPITRCARCGRLRHVRVESADHGHFKAHMNLAFTFPPLPSHGREELDEEQVARGAGPPTDAPR